MNNCTSCRFSVPTIDKDGAVVIGGPRVCRRYPPVPTMFPGGPKGMNFDFLFPIMRGDLWCGEWQGVLQEPMLPGERPLAKVDA